ncbi:DEAD/DEAH box helicase [Salirhabdus salicampi]|uniref:DEAD/DEAH box helicase n=1 Tax=Salirhabdus salicampi TaxID=476102 RepID=UPI0020C3BC3F|nr:helicase-related protein [Salirhabdus salicampi]MCP8617592.1 DEAD/DEAH box helicase family protein [Salirhabdus salicampi]
MNEIVRNIAIQRYARVLQGKQLLRSELPFSSSVIAWLLQDGYLKKVPSIEARLFHYRCNRCGNRETKLFAEIPRKGQREMYCRKCIQMGRASTFEPLYVWIGPTVQFPKVRKASRWNGTLTYFQHKASKKINSAMEDKEKLLVWAVCGAGKTEMLFSGLEQCFFRGERVCLVSPRADVIKELVPRFRQSFPNVTIASLYGGTNDKDEGHQFILATTHQLLRYKEAFDVLVIDEVDAFPYHHDPMLPFAVARARRPRCSFIYLTATPRFLLKWQAKLRILPAVFVPQRYHGQPLPVPRFLPCFHLRKDIKKGEVPNELKVWIQEKEREQRAFLIFAPTIDDAEFLSNKLSIPYVHAEDSNREQKVNQFRESKMLGLITTTILERGVTFPSIDVFVFDAGHNVFDAAALVQIAGRVGRSQDDPAGDVVYFHDGVSRSMIQAIKLIEKMNRMARRTR